MKVAYLGVQSKSCTSFKGIKVSGELPVSVFKKKIKKRVNLKNEPREKMVQFDLREQKIV